MNYKPIIRYDDKELEDVEQIVIILDHMDPSVVIKTKDKELEGKLLTVKHFDARMRFLVTSVREICSCGERVEKDYKWCKECWWAQNPRNETTARLLDLGWQRPKSENKS